MSTVRYWGLFTVAIMMLIGNFGWQILIIEATDRPSTGTSLNMAMWAFVAFFAFRGDAESIKWLGLIMVTVRVGAAFLNFSAINDRELAEISLPFNKRESLVNVGFDIAIWLGVALRARHLMNLRVAAENNDKALPKSLSSQDLPHEIVPMAETPPPQSLPTEHEEFEPDVPPDSLSMTKNTLHEAQPGQNDELINLANRVSAGSSDNAKNVSAEVGRVDTDPPLTEQNSPDLNQFPNAMLAIEYGSKAQDAWKEIRLLPPTFQHQFLERLEEEPRGDAHALATFLRGEFDKLQRPFGSENANDALADVRTIGSEAEEEFKRVYETLGETIPLGDIVERIEGKFGPTAKTREREQQHRREQEEIERREWLEQEYAATKLREEINRKKHEESRRKLDAARRLSEARAQEKSRRRRRDINLTVVILGTACALVLLTYCGR